MPTTLRLKPEIEDRYAALAAETGRTKSFYFNKALEDAIARFEYEYGLLRDVEDIRAGRLKTHGLEEVGEMLGLED